MPASHYDPDLGSLRRRNVGMLFSRKGHLKYVLMKYEISILSCLKTIHPKNIPKILLRRRLLGYKDHVAMDQTYGFIRGSTVTDSACHDGAM